MPSNYRVVVAVANGDAIFVEIAFDFELDRILRRDVAESVLDHRRTCSVRCYR